MGERSSIEWTHATFNPWIGCTKVHTGCKNCYAEAQNKRWAHNGGTWGVGAPRRVTSDANWRKPMAWARAAAKAGERHRVFCASLADVLDEEAPADAQARLWSLIRQTAFRCSGEENRIAACMSPVPGMDGGDCANCGRPAGGLDWLLLTKRPERWEVIPEDVRPLVWFGTSVSDQATADQMIPRLLGADGFRLRFLSMEPLIGPVDLGRAMRIVRADADGVTFGLSWVIVGGESGPGARPCDVTWIRSVVEQCATGVPCFVKQLGASVVNLEYQARLADPKGGDPSEWPADLRVRQFPGVRS